MTYQPPAWATEPIHITEPDPDWESIAERLASDLQTRLQRWLDGPVEHVGSTAVPGLAAKPVVDLMAPLRHLDADHEVDGRLAEAGWVLVPPELDQRPWRRFHVLPEGQRRFAHLQLVELRAPRYRETLAFRDALRQRPDLVQQYGALKREAAHVHGEDREAYSAAKASFVRSVLAGCI